MNNQNFYDNNINLLEQTDNQNPQGKKFKISKFIIYLFTILLITFLIFTYQVLFTNTSLMDTLGGKNSIFKQLTILARGGAELRGMKEDRINILLTGMGGAGHDGPYLTDTIILASIQPSTNRIAFFSIPRDLAVEVPGYGKEKINYLNHYGEMNDPSKGGEYAKDQISKLFDIPIDYYVRLDFNGFEKIIDDLGGIKINVERGFIDYQFPAPNFAFQVVSFEPGWQTMDGDTALKYVRSRHGNNGEGSDFARSQRQQLVITAVKDRALSYQTVFNPRQLSKLLEAVGSHVRTDMEISDIVALYKLSKDLKLNDARNVVFDDRPNGFLVANNLEGSYMLEPRGGNFTEMQYAIKNAFQENTQIQKEINPISVEIRNGTEVSGLAFKLQEKIKQAGVKVIKIGNAPTTDYTETVIYQLSPDSSQEAITEVQKNISGRIEKIIPEWVKSDAELTTEFFIIIGTDNEGLSN